MSWLPIRATAVTALLTSMATACTDSPPTALSILSRADALQDLQTLGNIVRDNSAYRLAKAN